MCAGIEREEKKRKEKKSCQRRWRSAITINDGYMKQWRLFLEGGEHKRE